MPRPAWKCRYSGPRSIAFWKAVRATRDNELYDWGCQLQNIEERLLLRLNKKQTLRKRHAR